MVRRGRCIALVVAFLIGCAVLPVVGCSGVRSGASKREKGHSPEATASKEEARCQGTRTIKPASLGGYVVTTNDIPGCPEGGLLKGTEGSDQTLSRHPAGPSLDGGDGDDTIRGLGGNDEIFPGPDDDVVYAGAGNDTIYPDPGKDVIYGGAGNDRLFSNDGDGQRDKLYCGAGRDKYVAGPSDYVDSSCEKKIKLRGGGGA